MRLPLANPTSRRLLCGVTAAWLAGAATACGTSDLAGCIETVADGPRPIATVRDQRFEGKVHRSTAQCRGGDLATQFLSKPWVDWSNYYGAGDGASKAELATKNLHGVGGALIDLEYQRVELIKFNLFDNAGSFEQYVKGRSGVDGATLKVWSEMRLPSSHPNYAEVGGAGTQRCSPALIRGRTLTGICNDVFNPLMGSSGTLFARNVEFEDTFPDLAANNLTKNRHGDRLSLLVPDPQVISRKLFTRAQSDPASCADGFGKPGNAKDANCDYKKAPFFNVLAAFWIQFMTHDWFSHMEEGQNAPGPYMEVGCASQKVNGVETPLTPADAARLGCRPADAIDRPFVADATPPGSFANGDRQYLKRAPQTFRNNNTAWWDASQIYGYDDTSIKRVKRDPADPARLQLIAVSGRSTDGDRQGYLPLLADSDPKLPDWAGQEAAAFPDNWTVGMSFLHTVFVREHNQFVDEFRRRAARTPDADCGLRNPAAPSRVIHYRDVTPDELFTAARLVVSAEIAKIHTIEWTPQLLYNEPLFLAMNGNWNGLFNQDGPVPDALSNVIGHLRSGSTAHQANELYSVLASGPGIVGLGSSKPNWNLANLEDVNGGVNHFGSPFNFPEEFISVYRLHPLLPDLIEYRDLARPNVIQNKVPIVSTFRAPATQFMRERGLSNWALSMGRQRLGLLTLQNHPRFMQNLKIDRLQSPTKQIDIAALDIIRDREHGIPRFNEFRRQYGLRQLTSFDDFVDPHVAADSVEGQDQRRIVATLREVYGQHRCDASKVITHAQRNEDGTPINDCLGHLNGSLVDNIEDVDTMVGYLAENARPHGFAISETQFVVFILNASRRLFSDRFLTSSFRPEFYTTLGLEWVKNNGPEPMFEPLPVNGHKNQPVSPLKRVLLRTMPELKDELATVRNAFDPWARDRGEYYTLAWKPRKGAESDEAFTQKQ
jgi:heme peroxidase